jgi:hypothetical protein
MGMLFRHLNPCLVNPFNVEVALLGRQVKISPELVPLQYKQNLVAWIPTFEPKHLLPPSFEGPLDLDVQNKI